MSRKEFEGYLHSALTTFRSLFEGTEIAKKIDDIFESELKRALAIIPEDSFEAVCHGILIFKAVYDSIAFDKLNDKLTSIGFDINLEIDLYKLALDMIKEKITDTKIRSGIISLVKKCKPIIDCFSLALSEPTKYLSKLAIASSTKYDDIL